MLHSTILSTTLLHWWAAWRERKSGAPLSAFPLQRPNLQRPNLQQLAQLPTEQLPPFVRNCPVAMKYLALLGVLDWSHFPERPGG